MTTGDIYLFIIVGVIVVFAIFCGILIIYGENSQGKEQEQKKHHKLHYNHSKC